MSYRFKDGPSGPDNMRPMGDEYDDRMMEGKKMPRDDMDEPIRGGPRPPFRGRGPSPGRDKPYNDRPRDFYRDDMGPGRDRSPLRGGYDDRYPDRFKRDEGPYPRREEMGRKDMGGRPYMDEPYDKYGGMEGRGGRFDGPGSGRFDHHEEPFRNRPFSYPNFPPYKGYYKPPDAVKINECEIIVINKQQRAYAENIEARMKNLGIQVDILFLKDEALLVQTIDDIARRGSLYAVVISPLNETHGSVTLNILYGTPQEHRNMPLDDALKLVARNFHDYMRSQREFMDRDRMERGFYAGSCPADREIQFLFKLLADGRQVTIGELETVLKYLTERHERMKGAQGDRGPGPANPMNPSDMPSGGPLQIPKDEMDMAQKEQDLQNRIMSIMNQGPIMPSEAAGGGGGGGAVGLMGQNKSSAMMGIPLLDSPGARPSQSELSPTVGGVAGPRPNMMQNRGGGGGMGLGPGPAGPNQQMGGQNQMGIGSNKPTMPQGMNQGQSGMGHNRPVMGPSMGPGLLENPPNTNQMGVTTSQSTSSPSPYINFDNPSVKKALDSLMQSGPNLLETISMTTAATTPSQDAGNKMQSNSGGAMQSQRGPGGMGDMGMNVGAGGMSQGNMASMQGMAPHQNRNMMGQQGGGGGGNMGPPGMGMRQGQNMGPGSMQNMGNRSGSSFQGQGGPQGYGGGPNMMGNRPPYMGGGGGGGGGGGPTGNQGMGGGGSGGPRRY